MDNLFLFVLFLFNQTLFLLFTTLVSIISKNYFQSFDSHEEHFSKNNGSLQHVLSLKNLNSTYKRKTLTISIELGTRNGTIESQMENRDIVYASGAGRQKVPCSQIY